MVVVIRKPEGYIEWLWLGDCASMWQFVPRMVICRGKRFCYNYIRLGSHAITLRDAT
jgi:hypothetical protein